MVMCVHFLFSFNPFTCILSSGEKPVNVASADLTAQEILGEVNWDLIDD